MKKSRQKHYWLFFSIILKHQLLRPWNALCLQSLHLLILEGPSHVKPAMVDSSRTSAACLCKAHGFWQQQKQLLPWFHVTHAPTWKFPARTIKDWRTSLKYCLPRQEWGCFGSTALITFVRHFIAPVSLKKDPNTKELTNKSHFYAIMVLFPLPWYSAFP